jgi:hypothetical protein
MQQNNAIDPLSVVQRNRVCLFVVSDCNPINMLRIERWKQQWQEAGFARIATGQSPLHLGWMKHVMREIHRDDPEAVFVVVAHASAAATVQSWVAQCSAEGLPIAQTLVFQRRHTDADTATLGPDTIVIQDTPAGHQQAVGYFRALAADRGVPVLVTSRWRYPHAVAARPSGDPHRYPEWSFIFDDRTEIDASVVESGARPPVGRRDPRQQ